MLHKQEKDRQHQQRRAAQATLEAEKALFYPDIDYEAHPFYRDLARPTESLAHGAFEHYVRHFDASLQAELAGAKYLNTHSTPSSETVLDSVGLLRRRGIVPLRLSDSDRRPWSRAPRTRCAPWVTVAWSYPRDTGVWKR